MFAVFKLEEQRIELGAEEFEGFIERLEMDQHIAADVIDYGTGYSMVEPGETHKATVRVIEATTGEWCRIGFEYRTGVLWVESEWVDAFMNLLKVLMPVAVMDPDEREVVA